MTQILWKTGKKSGGQKIENPPFLEAGDAAEVVFEPKQGLYLESYDECPGIGRIAVMDSNQLAMMGKVLDVKYESY